MHDLLPIIAVVVTFGVPAAVLITVARLRHKERMELIQRGIRPEESVPPYPRQTSLFLGLLFIGIGIGMVIYELWHHHLLSHEGSIITGAGIALLVYWKLTAKDRERKIRFIEENLKLKKEEASAVEEYAEVKPSYNEVNPPEE